MIWCPVNVSVQVTQRFFQMIQHALQTSSLPLKAVELVYTFRPRYEPSPVHMLRGPTETRIQDERL